MAHFSRLQITLHWLTLLLTGIAYAAIELRGGRQRLQRLPVYKKDMHYDMGVLVTGADVFYGYILNANTGSVITHTPHHWQHVAAKLILYRALSHFSRLTALLGVAMMASGGKSWSFGFTVPVFLTPDGT